MLRLRYQVLIQNVKLLTTCQLNLIGAAVSVLLPWTDRLADSAIDFSVGESAAVVLKHVMSRTACRVVENPVV